MKQKTILFLLIKFSGFIYLIWIRHSSNVLSTFNKSPDENYCVGEKADTINYRSLAKYKQGNSNKIHLKEKFPNNGAYEKKDIYNNEIGYNGKNKQSNKNILNKALYYTEVKDCNNVMFDGKHFHFEKKWIKKKDYDNFLEKNRRIGDIDLKKIKFRNYGFGGAIFFIFFILGIGIPICSGIEHLDTLWNSIKSQTFWSLLQSAYENVKSILGDYTYITLFSILMFMLSVILIVAIYKILINNEKCGKIKLISELNEQ
ncbi:hypothetical protein MKS88_001256 [Plasmodium brasilianum]|uniref:Uncharacterized protein n=1 Tax=Plasmodium brasilianum TaxID=5824 RepID=A0ACB9YF70_PLABR|nr:hypothetical protein MKS88_001256 [Plasmodium brasilianum]